MLADSRYVTVYGRVLEHDRARRVLRGTGDLSLAGQVVDELELEPRARHLARSVDLFLDTLNRAEAESFSNDLLQAVEELSRLARSARDIVGGRLSVRDIDF